MHASSGGGGAKKVKRPAAPTSWRMIGIQCCFRRWRAPATRTCTRFDREEDVLQIKRTTRMQKLFDVYTYAYHEGYPENVHSTRLSYFHDGTRITGDQTGAEAGLEEDSRIDVTVSEGLFNILYMILKSGTCGGNNSATAATAQFPSVVCHHFNNISRLRIP